MEETQVSRTALVTAYIRAYHAAHDTPTIFDDFLAHHLLTAEDRQWLEPHLIRSLHLLNPTRAASCPDQATALAWSMQAMATPPITLGRARYAEDSLEEAIRHGVRQYVLLGAGMDTFTFRRTDLLDHLQVFEVDHPATQAFKRQRLAEAGLELPEALHFVPVDLARESLASALTRSAYDRKLLTFFSWLGVTMYLTREAVLATLRAIVDVAPTDSAVVFDHLDTDAFVPDKVAKRVHVLLENVRRLGEPMNAGFDPSMLAADLAPLGLWLHEDLSPHDIEARYFQGRTDGYHACEHVHFACAVVV